MTAEHTAGPWPITWGHVIDIGGIATVPQTLDGRHTANSHLIAAAPELLEALHEIVEFFQPNAWGSVTNRNDALAKARAAITKATGETA